jgi:hypothetical protein
MSNEAARPVSVNIGRPKALTHRGKHVPNGVFETPLEGTLRMDKIELEGGAQADFGADRDRRRKHLAHWKPSGIKGGFGRNAKGSTESGVPDLRGEEGTR